MIFEVLRGFPEESVPAINGGDDVVVIYGEFD